MSNYPDIKWVKKDSSKREKSCLSGPKLWPEIVIITMLSKILHCTYSVKMNRLILVSIMLLGKD